MKGSKSPLGDQMAVLSEDVPLQNWNIGFLE